MIRSLTFESGNASLWLDHAPQSALVYRAYDGENRRVDYWGVAAWNGATDGFTMVSPFAARESAVEWATAWLSERDTYRPSLPVLVTFPATPLEKAFRLLERCRNPHCSDCERFFLSYAARLLLAGHAGPRVWPQGAPRRLPTRYELGYSDRMFGNHPHYAGDRFAKFRRDYPGVPDVPDLPNDSDATAYDHDYPGQPWPERNPS